MVLGPDEDTYRPGVAPFPAGSVVPYLAARTPREVLSAAGSRCGGAVLSGEKGLEQINAFRPAAAKRKAAQGCPMALVDPATYLPRKKKARQLDLPYPSDDASDQAEAGGVEADSDGSWWRFRAEGAGLASLLTTGPVVRAADRYTLLRGLRRWADQERAVPVVAVTSHWLRTGLDVLIELVGQEQRPVALVLADSHNALDPIGAVAGLVRLIAEVRPLPISLLRCDISAIGAVAFGAALGAVGLTTGTRHCGLGTRPPKGRPVDLSPSVFLPRLFDYRKTSSLPGLAAAPLLMTCTCLVCRGGSLLRFAESHDTTALALHNLHSAEDIAAAVLADADPASAWVNRCHDAVAATEQLIAVDGAAAVPSWLRQWATLTGEQTRWSAR